MKKFINLLKSTHWHWYALMIVCNLFLFSIRFLIVTYTDWGFINFFDLTFTTIVYLFLIVFYSIFLIYYSNSIFPPESMHHPIKKNDKIIYVMIFQNLSLLSIIYIDFIAILRHIASNS